MAGFKRKNTHNGGVLLFTLVLDGELIDKNYILKKLTSGGIGEVDGVRRKDGSTERINPEQWLNKKFGGRERNYCWLLFFMTIFCARRWPQIEAKDYEQYKNISSDYFNTYLPNSKGQRTIIRSILEAAGVLKWNDHYLTATAAAKTGAAPFTKSIAVADGFDKVTYRSVPEVDTTGVIDNDVWLNNRDIIPITGDQTTTDAIAENYKKIRVVDDAVEQCEGIDFVTRALKKGKDPEKAKQFAIRLLDKISSYAGMSLKDSEREHWNYGFSYRDHTGRCYHDLCNLSEEVRHLVSIKGAPIWAVDASAAHPFLLMQLYDRARGLDHKIEAEKKKYSTRFSYNNDFYSSVGELGKIPRLNAAESDEDYRGRIKGMFWQFIYGEKKTVQQCPFTFAYQRLYPILLDTVNRLKSEWWMAKDSSAIERIQQKLKQDNRRRVKRGDEELPLSSKAYKQLSYLVSQLEGEIVIKGVCNELATKGVQVKGKMVKPWFIPLHDAVLCQQSMVKPIKQLMKRWCLEKTGDTAPFTAKPWG
jgi:hypothetical protein